MSEIKKIDAKEFRESGLLQEINRCFMHPIGLAIEISINDDGSEFFSGIWDCRDDPEGILFADEDIDKEKIKNVREMTGKKLRERQKAVGFIIQMPKDEE